ncbi:ankyrin repeat domain-containing protein [Aquisphaera giovannonii]|uniref:ankyrin repeat domain-containing protein n=1 Tax=Aquisphaera giovannonii TaxID=406548 RepID=UPI0011DFD790|nr:ankyrin repeat domain-containing protein [Aquisphaera giovannonii]
MAWEEEGEQEHRRRMEREQAIKEWFAAVERGDEAAVLEFLDQGKDIKSGRDRTRITALMIAAGDGQAAMVRLLGPRQEPFPPGDHAGHGSCVRVAVAEPKAMPRDRLGLPTGLRSSRRPARPWCRCASTTATRRRRETLRAFDHFGLRH